MAGHGQGEDCELGPFPCAGNEGIGLGVGVGWRGVGGPIEGVAHRSSIARHPRRGADRHTPRGGKGINIHTAYTTRHLPTKTFTTKDNKLH